jgi:UDP-N-acetyl-D-glucosamine dehydrogenase
MSRRAAQPLQSRRVKAPDLARRITAKTAKIGIIGLGYVGLPLACLFAEKGSASPGSISIRRRSRS